MPVITCDVFGALHVRSYLAPEQVIHRPTYEAQTFSVTFFEKWVAFLNGIKVQFCWGWPVVTGKFLVAKSFLGYCHKAHITARSRVPYLRCAFAA